MVEEDLGVELDLVGDPDGETWGRTTWSGLTDPPVIPEPDDEGADVIDIANVVLVEAVALVMPRPLSAEVFTVDGSDENALMAMSEMARMRIAPLPAALPDRLDFL